jgi:hypothetical protein
LLNDVEERYGTILTYRWRTRFVDRDYDAITDGKVCPQENPRLEVPREFLDLYLAIVRDEIVGLKFHCVFNIDEAGTADQEEY